MRTTWIALGVAMAFGTTAAAQGLSVEAKVCKKVEDRECVEPADSFSVSDGAASVWTKVTGAKAGDSLHHVYFKGDGQTDDITLSVGGSPWRVWSKKTLRADLGMEGDWRIEVRDGSGAVLQTLKFSVAGGPTATTTASSAPAETTAADAATTTAAAPAGAAPAGGDWKVEAKVCKKVENRDCAEEAATFAIADGQVSIWTKVNGPSSGGTIHHVYFRGDQQTDDIALTVGGSPWRVYSRKTLRADTGMQGDWRVEIRDPGGAVIETVKFSVQ